MNSKITSIVFNKSRFGIKSPFLILVVAFLLMFNLVAGAISADAATRIQTTDQRVAGANRYETSFAVGDALKAKVGSFDNVVVASGRNFPDALSGAFMARVAKAPLYLETQGYDDELINKIKANMIPTGTVYILGGIEAVSESFQDKAANAGLKVERLEGRDRFATNLEILYKMFPAPPIPGSENEVPVTITSTATDQITNEALIVASGKNYADALSGSALKYPMMLVGDALTGEQRQFLEFTAFKTIYILGGSNAVNTAIEGQLKQYATVERISGANRFDTGRKVAEKFFPNAEMVTLVSGLSFPDGLSGSSLAIENNSPILLTSADNYTYAKSFVSGNKITKDLTIGGTAAVSDKVVSLIMEQYEGGNNHVHIWTSSFKWDGTEAVATFKCVDCSETESKDADVSFRITEPATRTEVGNITFTAKATGPDGISRSSTKNKSLPKLSHDFTWDWNVDRYNSGSTSFTVKAYAYTGTKGWGSMGASGKPAVPGTVAVDRSIIPLGTRLYIEGYGFAVANDTGGAIIGHTIDVVLNEDYLCRQWGIRYPELYIIE